MSSAVETVKIFYCYAHEDKPFRDELEKHLRILKRQRNAITWDDDEISPGTEWAKEIEKHLNEAQIILLLVSSDFMDSDYCYTVEMERALERHKNNEARVIPIILRHVYWGDAPFRKLQALPKYGKPVKSYSDQDEAYLDIATGIQKVVKEFEISNFLNEAESQFKRGRYQAALDTYSSIIKRDDIAIDDSSNLIRIYLGRGNTLKAMKRLDDALKSYDEALQVNQKSIDVNIEVGLTLFELKRYDEALEAYEKVHLTDSKNAIAYKLKGDVYCKIGLHKLASKAYSEAINNNPNFISAYFNRGLMYDSLGNLEEALNNYNATIKLDADFAKAYIYKSNIFYKMKNYKASLENYKQAVRIDPSLTDNNFKEKLQSLLEYIMSEQESA